MYNVNLINSTKLNKNKLNQLTPYLVFILV